MPKSIAEVIDLLQLEELEVGLFRGTQPSSSHFVRVFGGQVAAQATMAAQMTVPEDRPIHSMHSYFVLGGDPNIPIVYEVENVRDGGSFTTRRVAARQHGEIIFFMTASFHKVEEGFSHQDAAPQVPRPEDCPTLSEFVASTRTPSEMETWADNWAAFEFRIIGESRLPTDPAPELVPAIQRLWFRSAGAVDGSPIMHRALFTYISDFTLLSTSLVPHGLPPGSNRAQVASLDHAIWFHRPFRADEWLLYDQTSPSAAGARGLSTARVFNLAGELVASVAQEGLIRPIRADRERSH